MTWPCFEVSELSIQFGGVKAVQAVSFSIDAGMIYAVIGPNGAGKTTLFNPDYRRTHPTAGSIRLDGQPVHGLTPDRLAQRRGAHLSEPASVHEYAGHRKRDGGRPPAAGPQPVQSAALRWPALRRADAALRDEAAAELMRFCWPGAVPDRPAPTACLMARSMRLEIARALASRPRLLFLDEPAAGLNPETQEVDALVRRIADAGVTVVLVEHDMKMVMNLSERILVLDYGKKLAEGNRDEIRRNPDVIAAYLGAHA